MKILLTNALICDPLSEFDKKKCDVFIEDFIVKEITATGKKTPTVKINKNIDASGMLLMPGLTDMRANFCDPGFEHKENLQSGANAALYGGFTTVCVLPDTNPPLHNKTNIEYIVNNSINLPINILPYGSISYKLQGKDLSEMYDMHLAGAAAFTDANNPVSNASLMLRALLYAKIFGGLVLSHAEDTSLSDNGKMHEGNTSTNLGLKGIAGISEEIIILRDLELARYAQTRIHFSHISTKGSVELIKKAKKQGLNVTCDVAIANLCYTDENLSAYDTNFKLNPPLRSKTDKKALWDAVIDGTIDCIVSDHQPQNIENKQVEFDYAAYGINTMQTALSMLLANAPQEFTVSNLVKVFCHNPNKILGQKENTIKINNTANIILYNPKLKWMYNDISNQSKSVNSALYGKELIGKTAFAISKNKLHIL